MHKVICEEPRHGRGPWKKNGQANLPLELLPSKQGMRRPYKDRKFFGEHLGPLRRWLHSQVGRPWNDVYSEACAVIKQDSVVRAHIKTHLLDYVERNTFMHEGEVCVVAFHRSDGCMPVTETCCGPGRFYVHPETNLLCELPARPRKRWRDVEAEKRALTQRWLGKNVALHQIRGFWYKCYFQVVPVGVGFNEYDLIKERVVSRGELTRDQSQSHYLRCTVKHQLSRRELRRYGLRNASAVHSEGAQPSSDHLRSADACASRVAHIRSSPVPLIDRIGAAILNRLDEPDYAFPDRLDGCEFCAVAR